MSEPEASASEFPFEQLAVSNGVVYWLASDLMRALGYESWPAFKQVLNKAIGVCMTLGIVVEDNFVQTSTIVNGEATQDYRLSRFACYLTSMNGDVRKPQVAFLQGYLAEMADAARQYMEMVHGVERVQIRDEVSYGERALSSTASRAGVDNFPLFQNEGYRGMYNMDLGQLKRLKGLGDSKRSLLDFMGKRELAGNLFRITETEARLKNTGVNGQLPAQRVAREVGKKVRGIMLETGGPPENLPLSRDIKEVRQGLKQAARRLKKIDGRRPKALPEHPAAD